MIAQMNESLILSDQGCGEDGIHGRFFFNGDNI